MASNPSVVCWDSDKHSTMLGLSIVGVLAYPVLILATIGHVTFRYNKMCSDGHGLKMLVRYRFLFQRFKPTCYFWGLCYILRNFLISLTPVIFFSSALWQILVITLIVIASLVGTADLKPWRTPIANVAEIWSTVGLVIFMQCASFFVGAEGEEKLLGIVLTLFFASILVMMLGIFLNSVIKRFFPGKAFGAFLCHHKEGAGCLARWIKTKMEAESGFTIFLDSDQLEDIELIFDIVRTLTSNLVILESKMVLTRPWCAGEICSAKSNSIPIIPLALNDWVETSEESLAALDTIWSEQQKNLLIGFGCTLDGIKDAYRFVKSLPNFSLDRFEPVEDQISIISEVTRKCSLGSKLRLSTSPKKSQSGDSLGAKGTSKGARIAISGCIWGAETRCTCEILRQMTQRKTGVQCEVVLTPGDAALCTETADYLVAVLTSGLLTDSTFTEVLYIFERARKAEPVELRPVLADQNFNFPGPEYYAEMEAAGERGQHLAAGFKRMLSIVALGFNAQGSSGIMDQQVTEFSRRLGLTKEEARRYKVDLDFKYSEGKMTGHPPARAASTAGAISAEEKLATSGSTAYLSSADVVLKQNSFGPNAPQSEPHQRSVGDAEIYEVII